MYFTSGIQLSEALAALPGSKVGTYVPFDSAFYAATYMGTYQGTLTPLEHFVQVGADRMYKPNSTFDPVYYANKYDDLRGAGLNSADLLYHFMQYGLDEGRAPSQALAEFDGNFYLAANPDVAAYVNANLDQFGGSLTNGALAHYVKFGGAEGRSGPGTAATAGRNFILEESTVAGVKAMVLHGDQDIRIDMTKTANQITGLDLNGDGVIANDGKENALNVKPASGYVAVDAYTRLDNGVVNENNMAKVFLGDIKYDGSGFAGDGVSTNGNVVLGGLGADTILGGIGNDFLAGGGVAVSRNGGTDTLSGGRNADFLFAELSLLSNTDGNKLFLDGGSTADDTSAANGQSSQDSDWLLLQASDDDERIEVVLNENPGVVGTTPDANDGTLVTRAGQYASLRDIENIDASGNTYGFLKGLTTAVGGAPTGAANPNNNGIGSSGQLNITGSSANNIIIGGYDNDSINGRAGNDLLMGGNLNMLIDPNLVGLVGNNDGRDELIGGTGSDNIVFEADGGIIEGGSIQSLNDDPSVDTLWLTANSLGAVKTATALTPVAADALTTDNTLRFDLGVGRQGGLNNFAGYGGADKNAATGNYTADQTNYTAANAGLRVQVQDMENVIATGLGAIDFKAAGANTAADLTFDNQQNFQRYAGNLDLRGTDGANILYASNGTDTLEGRTGGTYTYNSAGVIVDNRDKLSGGNGLDTFIFGTQNGSTAAAQAAFGDNIDVIHRQKDANGDNLWDNYNDTTGVGDYEQDFGLDSATSQSASALRLTLNVSAADTVSNPLVANDVRLIDITVDGVAVVLTTAGMAAAPTMADLLTEVQSALTTLADPDLTASLSNNTISIISASGKVLGGSGYVVQQNSGGSFANIVAFEPTIVSTAKDVLLFKAYEDRSDNEAVNDNSSNGSSISLGVDSYAQDRVVSFDADGTRIAEDQQYNVVFDNLTTQDVATIKVNGVQFQLTVGVDLDGNPIAGEDVTSGATQAAIQNAFVARLNGFINSFMDTNTAAGSVNSAVVATVVAGDTLVLTQNAYGSSNEQTVFMAAPVVTVGNQSGGQPATWTVENRANHEVLLFNFDGRDGLLNNESVKFIGDTGVNRSLLATAKTAGETIVGFEASVVDSGADDLVATVTNTAVNGVPATTPVTPAAAVTNNTNTNSFLQTNFAVHGDDLLMGGAGNDTIFGRTGDDRVMGSLGTDTVDGGKNWYAVQVLGETQARVVEMNSWEAGSPAVRVTALAGLVISSTTQILQTENGTAAPIAAWDGVNAFDDTLQFQQADFGANARFTITIAATDFTASTVGAGAAAVTTVALQKGGAGTVGIDLAGDGALDVGQVTTFSNFENIRTVSGTDLATAGHGQGFDTLNVAALSTALGGIRYELSNGANAGELRYDTTSAAVAATAAQTSGNFATAPELIISIDGVENVIAGTGKDYLIIDETEAAKNNSFDGSLGVDVIDYQNNYGLAAALERAAEPTLTIKVNAQTNVDTVTMTNGRVGATGATDTPTDTLTDVEFINLNSATATGSREADTLDVRSMTAGAVVDYTNGEVRTAGSLAGANVQVTIGNIAQIENVIADGDDTVIVAGSGVMGANVTSDLVGAAVDLLLPTFLDFDELSATTGKRVAYSTLATGAGIGAGQMENAINQSQFKFDLGTVGTDTVDYSSSTDAISVRVELDATLTQQYVAVDADGVAGFLGTVQAGDRVDQLINVERIVAAQGESVLDLTQSTKGLEISFQARDAANYVAALDRDVYNVQISDLSSSVPLTRSYVEYRDAGLVLPATAATTQATATWSRIEGSDNAEKVILNSAHSLDATNTFNLRGGANEVKYNELTKSINLNLSVSDFVAATPLTTGLVTGVVTFQDGTGAGVVGPILAGSGTHTITSYTANNGIAAGSLRIAASQDAEDNLVLSGLGSKVFLIAQTGTTDNQITVQVGSGTAQNSVILTGFELVTDANTDDVYDFGSIVNAVAGLDFIDNNADHDTVKVDIGAAAVAFGGVAGTTISLPGINAAAVLAPAGFDFDVLDVSGIDTATLTTLTGVTAVAAVEGTAAGVLAAPVGFGASDEVVLGKINNVTSALAFESVVLTQATVAEVGTTFTMNTTTNTLVAGAKSITLTDLANTLSFGGTVLEQQTNGTLRAATALNATSGVTVTTIGAEAVNFTGGNGNDSLTGSSGADTLRGGSGNDTLDGSFVAEVREVHSYTIGNSAIVGATYTLNGVTVTAGAATPGDPSATIVAENDADAVGAAFVRVWNATPGAFTVNNASVAPDTISSVTYDALTNVLSFTYAAGANPADALLAAPAGTGAALSVSAVAVTAFAPQAESADTFVFEATAALNGADIFNNVDASDTLNFSAFLGNANGGGTVVAAGDAGAGFAGVVVAAADDFVVAFNKATLATTDFVSGAVLTAGKFSMTDGDSAVYAVSADVNGVADVTINAWNLYYVSNGAVAGASDLTVTLVGTVNSNAELSAAAVGAML